MAKKKAKKAAEPEVAQIDPDMKKPIRKYGASETFAPAEQVDHPKFGLGVVERAESGKITVFFPVGRKVLAQARSDSQLSRPRPFVID